MSMDSMEPMKCLQTSKPTSRLCLLFSILPPQVQVSCYALEIGMLYTACTFNILKSLN